MKREIGLDPSPGGSASQPDVKRVSGVSGPLSGLPAIDGRFRVAFVVFGGMVALQGSQSIDATKIAYLLGSLLCLLGAFVAVGRARRTSAVQLATPVLVASVALAAIIAVSLLVARTHGTSLIDWARDAAGYALFAAVPVLALDGHASSSRKLLVGMLVLAGLLGGLSWAVEWLGRRQIVDLPLARLVFASGQLPGLLYLFAMATAMTGGRRGIGWALLAGIVLGLFLITGTRSSLLLLVGPLVMMAILGRAQIGESLVRLVSHGAVAVGFVLAVQLAISLPIALGPGRTSDEPGGSGELGSPGPAPPAGPIIGSDRIGSLPVLVSKLASDPSVKERAAQYESAWGLFVSSPVVGVGLGHSIDWLDVSGRLRSGFTADTPLVMPAKFGLLGIFVFLCAAVAYGSLLRTALRRNRRSGIALTLAGYGIWVTVGLPLGFPIEDKGASLALVLLLALFFSEGAGRQPHSPAALDGVDVGVAEAQRTSR